MILVPQYKNSVEILGSVSLILKDELTGKIKDERYIPNIVTTAGKTFIASRMVSSASLMSHMGIGTVTGNPTPAVGDTTLGVEISGGGYSRASLTQSSAAAVVTYSATFGGTNPSSGYPYAVTEAGIFTAVTAGTMLCRTVFPVVTKQSGDSLTITWQITIQ